ncbi:MAG: PEGA domain-containing protein [Candidatus Methanoperedens sp.]|nr:PEGA domain-containing protein [Candidatus Methanoperedens sp.]
MDELLDAYEQYSAVETNIIRITVKATGQGDQYIRYRTAFLPIGGGNYVRNPNVGYETDFQGWYVYKIPVKVISKPVLEKWEITPTTAKPGDTVKLRYYIYNPNSENMQVTLGANLRNPSGQPVYDEINDIDVPIKPNRDWYERNFFIPANAETGLYDVIWGIHKAHLAGEYGYSGWQNDLLTVTPLATNLVVTIQSPAEGFSVTKGTATPVRALIKDNLGNIVTGASLVTATFSNGDSLLQLFDDGSNGDAVAHDGIYTNTWTPQTTAQGYTETASTITVTASHASLSPGSAQISGVVKIVDENWQEWYKILERLEDQSIMEYSILVNPSSTGSTISQLPLQQNEINAIKIVDKNGNALLSPVREQILYDAQSLARFKNDVTNTHLDGSIEQIHVLPKDGIDNTGKLYTILVPEQTTDWFQTSFIFVGINLLPGSCGFEQQHLWGCEIEGLNDFEHRKQMWSEVFLDTALQPGVFDNPSENSLFQNKFSEFLGQSDVPLELRDPLIDILTRKNEFITLKPNEIQTSLGNFPYPYWKDVVKMKNYKLNLEKVSTILGVAGVGLEIQSDVVRMYYINALANAEAEERMDALGKYVALNENDRALVEGYEIAKEKMIDINKKYYDGISSTLKAVDNNKVEMAYALTSLGAYFDTNLGLAAKYAKPFYLSYETYNYLLEKNNNVQKISLAATLQSHLATYLKNEKTSLSIDKKSIEQDLELFNIQYYLGYYYYKGYSEMMDGFIVKMTNLYNNFYYDYLNEMHSNMFRNRVSTIQISSPYYFTGWEQYGWDDKSWLMDRLNSLPNSPKLSISLSESNDPVASGASTRVAVAVSYIGSPVSDANVLVSVNTGSCSPTSGKTDASGIFYCDYIAPDVISQQMFGLKASVSKEGYNNGEAIGIITVNPLTIPYGSLYVTSNPSGAEVYLNPEALTRGIAPLTISNIPIGEYSITLKKSNYYECTKTITVYENQQVIVNCDLTPLPAQGYTSTFDLSPRIGAIQIDKVYYFELPKSFFWEQNSQHAISVYPKLKGNTGIQYTFNRWSDGNTQITRTITVTSDTSYNAEYKTQNYLYLTTNPENLVIISGAGWYDKDTLTTLNAPSVMGYMFKDWAVDGSSVSGDTISVKMDAPHAVIANYEPLTLTTIIVSPSSASLVEGETQTFTAADQNGNPIDVTWSSSDESMGIIDQNGVFTAKATGSITITATSGSISGQATATVTEKPSGARKLAFVSDKSGTDNIWSINSDGSGLSQLTFDAVGVNSHLDFSSDGTMIAWEKYNEGGSERIWSMKSDGSEQIQLTTEPGNHPQWSPDGTKILFNSQRTNYNGWFHVYLMNSDGTNQLSLGSEGTECSKDWSPDSKKIVYAMAGYAGLPSDLYVMNIDGTQKMTIASGMSFCRDISWSPDGSKIAYVSQENGNKDIYIINPDGTGKTQLTTSSSDDSLEGSQNKYWSPDSKKLIFQSDRNGNWDIYSINVDGTGLTQLTSDPANDFYPAMSSDGSKIAFISERSGIKSIWMMNTDGSNQVQVTDNTAGNVKYLDWSPAAAGSIPPPSGGTILLSDNFESYTQGTWPSSGWEPHYNIINDPTNNKVTNQYSSEGSNSLQIYGAQSGCWAAETGYPLTLSKEFYVEASMMPSGDISSSNSCHGTDIAIGLATAYGGSGVDWNNLFGFWKDGKAYGSNESILNNYNTMNWYSLKMRVNLEAGTVDYWVNGNYVDQQFSQTLKDKAPDYKYLYLGSGGGKGWVDNVKVYTLTPAQSPVDDIEAKITNIWGSIHPVVLFGQNAALGQVASADLDSSPNSEPLPTYTTCIGLRNSDKSVISRFKISDTKVKIIADIAGGTGYYPGSEGYIKITNPDWKITEILPATDIYEHDWVMLTDYYGTGINIDKVNGIISWSARGGCPSCGCHENGVTMTFIVEKISDAAPDAMPPTIDSISLFPSTVIAGSTIDINVSASDNKGVVEVTADGSPLTNSNGFWTGSMTAASAAGSYTVTIRAKDAANNIVESTATYTVVSPQGGIGIDIIPTDAVVSSGNSINIMVKLTSTQNFDDNFIVELTYDDIPQEYSDYYLDFSWTDWPNYRKQVSVNAKSSKEIPLTITVPQGVSGYKVYSVTARSTNWITVGSNTGGFEIS